MAVLKNAPSVAKTAQKSGKPSRAAERFSIISSVPRLPRQSVWRRGLRCLASYWPAARVSVSQRFGSFRDRVRLAELPRMDALYPLSRSKDLQQNSLHPELGISLEELGNEKDGMEAVADWPVPRLISCNPALWAGAGDWPAITEDANAVCCPPCSLGKCGDSLAICREAPRASELKLSVAMSTRKECRKIHLAPAVVWPLGRETQRVTLGAVRSL